MAHSVRRQNLGRDDGRALARLHDPGIMINGSFVFGLDGDTRDVFVRTVSWAIDHGITTATFHIAVRLAPPSSRPAAAGPTTSSTAGL